VGAAERSTPDVIAYELGDAASRSRALAVNAVGAAATLAPLLLAVELLTRNDWHLPLMFWAVGAALTALVLVRAFVQYGASRQRLRSLRVLVDAESITTTMRRDTQVIRRGEVGRIVEIDGWLGGLRVEPRRDPSGALGPSVTVPRGGPGFGELRAALERWRPVERRGRRGPGLRIVTAVGIVAGVFFLPFLLDDVVLRSRWIAPVSVVLIWSAMRWAMRGR
jgi:hypothetical protein